MFTKIADFLSEPIALGGMVVLLLALIGAMIFIRSRNKDDE